MTSFLKKTLFSFLLFFILTPPVLAVDLGIGPGSLGQDAAKGAGYNISGTTEFTVAETVGMVVQVLLAFLGIIFTILLLMAGFKWMTAQGDEGRVEEAQNTIRTAIIGIIIVLGSYSLSSFIVRAIIGR